VKPNKVDFGLNIYEAAKKKYIDNDEDQASEIVDDYYDEDKYLFDSSRWIQ
jgi:hypothetical protein